MNLVMDYLNSLLDDASARMDKQGIPSIVRQACPYCSDTPKTMRETICVYCAQRGYVLVESPRMAK